MAKRNRKKTRRLWLQVKFKVPDNVSPRTVARKLIESVRSGDYEYPESWHVVIRWKNSLFGKFKVDEFTEAMEESAQSSRGWDSAVIAYLQRSL